jgi:ubiquinone/menaquinone biosynthesis C-methylase UbiE
MNVCIHNNDIIYNVWDAPRKTKRFKNELLRYFQILTYIPKNVKKILDLGCGTGFMSCLLAKEGFDITAVDVSSERLSLFHQKAKELNINVKNLNFFEFNEMDYDLVICQEVIEHLPDYSKLIDKIYFFLKTGGYAIITTPYKENLEAKTKKCDVCGQYYHTSGHLHSFDENKLQNVFPEGAFEIVTISKIVNNRAIRLFKFYNLPVNKFLVNIDKLFNKLFDYKAAYLLILVRKIK